jgi:hypothetical protein
MNTIMKKMFSILAVVLAFVSTVWADDKPIAFNQLPEAAQSFIAENYPAEKIIYATVDDDLIRPDYTVVLESGVKIEFQNDGSLEKISSRQDGIPAEIIPAQIREYVRHHYPGAAYVEYEVGRKTYEVTLSNRMELKFNSSFAVVEIDD